MEEAILLAPDQYWWLHRRFKTRPLGENLLKAQVVKFGKQFATDDKDLMEANILLTEIFEYLSLQDLIISSGVFF